MKKLKLILAVALIVITCSVLLIGCTPSKPNDYMTKWNESKNKSVTTIETMDKVVKEESEGVYKEVAGTTTIETTYISSGNILMAKRIEIINEKDKNGKDFNGIPWILDGFNNKEECMDKAKEMDQEGYNNIVLFQFEQRRKKNEEFDWDYVKKNSVSNS